VNKFERKSCINATVDVAPAVRVSVGLMIDMASIHVYMYANVRACCFGRFAHLRTIARRYSTSIALLRSNARSFTARVFLDVAIQHGFPSYLQRNART
jgi:hypothetical protein